MQDVRLLLGHRWRFRGDVATRSSWNVSGARFLIQSLARRSERLHENGANNAVFVLIHLQRRPARRREAFRHPSERAAVSAMGH